MSIRQYLYEMKQALDSIDNEVSHLPTAAELRTIPKPNPEPMQTGLLDAESLETFHQHLAAIATTLRSIDDRILSLIEVSERQD